MFITTTTTMCSTISQETRAAKQKSQICYTQQCQYAMTADYYNSGTTLTLTLAHASMWCCSMGTPATGNKGLGTSNDSGLNRVPAKQCSSVQTDPVTVQKNFLMPLACIKTKPNF